MRGESATICMRDMDAKEKRDSLLAFEMRCYRRILHIRWQQKITNVEIRRRLEIKRNVVQLIIDRKLKLFGHISRMDDNRLVKVMVSGMMDGKNKRGRPSKE